MLKSMLFVVITSSSLVLVTASPLVEPEQTYLAGLKAFEGGELILGQNLWVRYQACCRLRPESCNLEHLKQVHGYFSVRRTDEKPVPAESPVQASSIVAHVEKAPRVRSQEKLLSKPSVHVVQRPNSKKLVEQAERAREQGRYELAIRYYEWAEKADPARKEYQKAITDLEKMME